MACDRIYTYIPPAPPNDLIGCNSYTLDFNDRKFIQIGIDPKKSFSVMIHIITPSRYVSITSHYMKTIYTLMGDILSSVMEKPENTQTTFLSDTNLSLTKMVYKDENVLVIESQAVNGCRILLNRRDLKKTGCFFPTKETNRTELLRCIMEVSCITITSAIEPMSDPNYISEIKRFAAEELADVWMKKITDRNDIPKAIDVNDGPTRYDWRGEEESQCFSFSTQAYDNYKHTEKSTWAPRKLEF
ncbi:uncharacterized protein LOC126837657 [Adelges cooleyi]|uniref:uncharacterized protein LOC126837657 n=1 Tax=Adelges cooleyi TaxID=133065 RepID=UPI00217F9CC0|nr:uncharacterized protein LOC126837657 [Adelges cooleyi]